MTSRADDQEQTATTWLIANGWKPSPTTWTSEGGFEHPRRSRVPRAYAESVDVYDTHSIRLPKHIAVVVQAVHEQALADEVLERASWIGSTMLNISEWHAALWHRIGARP